MTASLSLDNEWIVLADVPDADQLIAAIGAKAGYVSGAGRVWSVHLAEDVEVPSVWFGKRGDLGALMWCDEEDAYIPINGVNSDWVDYFTWGSHHFSMPPGAEVPVELAYEALREFVRTGERPTCVEWRVDES